MAQPTVLITGSDHGIGAALVEAYATRQWNVIATVHDEANPNTLKRLPTVRVVHMDVTDQASITRTAVHFSGEKIDLLINNASVLIRDGLEEFAGYDFLAQLQVNTLAPFLVTRAFLPNLRLAVEKCGVAKFVNVGSRMGSITENVSGGLYGYRASMAGLHMVTKSLAIDLKHEKIAVLLVDPGHVATEGTTANDVQSPRASAEKMIQLIERSNEEDVGKFLHADGARVPW